MGHLMLVTGGTRSGKSGYAQTVAESLPGSHCFIATCPRIDPEMDDRIQKHRNARSGGKWSTIEEEVDLAGVFDRLEGPSVCLVDCLTLWVNNLLFEEERSGRTLTERVLEEYCRNFLARVQSFPGTVICVTNEVGMGIVPDNAAARRYRDLVGRCNQLVAGAADKVVLVSCGIPLVLKG